MQEINIVATVEYFTHDNGGQPFKVQITKNNKVNVYKQDYIKCKPNYKYKVSYSPKEIFIGKSPKNATTFFSGGYGNDCDGNTILLHISDNTYVFIGDEIYSFESYDKIVRFVSPVGNNDVPYPYAYDKSNNAYLFSFGGIVVKSNDELNQIMKEEIEFEKIADKFSNHKEFEKENGQKPIKDGDPNDYYMKHHLMTPDRGYVDWKNIFKDCNFQYSYLCIGKGQYTMTLSIDPEKDYDRFMSKSFEKYGNKMLLTKDDYCAIMREFAEKKYFAPFKNKIIIETD
jgi:hypothetical protein